MPRYAEAWFAVLKWQKIAETYNRAVEKILELIRQQAYGKLYNWRAGKLGEQYLQRHEPSEKRLSVVAGQQDKYDIIIIPAQFGLRHSGCSVHEARATFSLNEFGLGMFEVGCMLLTHPERLVSYVTLWIDCPGDKYSPEGDGNFSDVPYFGFLDDRIQVDAKWFDIIITGSGSASAFLSY